MGRETSVNPARIRTMRDGAVVFVITQHTDIRESVQKLVKSVGLDAKCFPDTREFLKSADVDRRGCIVMDVQSPIAGIFTLQRDLAERDRFLPVIMITDHADVPTAVEAMKAGAFDFVMKPFCHNCILGSIQSAVDYDGKHTRARARRSRTQEHLKRLTAREREVAALVVQGFTSNTIATRLGLKRKTVEIYRAHINKKMEARNVASLVRILDGLDLEGLNIEHLPSARSSGMRHA